MEYYEIRNSLGVVKRQEKELNLVYDEDLFVEADADSALEDVDVVLEEVDDLGPKVFESVSGYSEETLALATIFTAIIALLVGFVIGILVTRICAGKSATTNGNANPYHPRDQIIHQHHYQSQPQSISTSK